MAALSSFRVNVVVAIAAIKGVLTSRPDCCLYNSEGIFSQAER